MIALRQTPLPGSMPFGSTTHGSVPKGQISRDYFIVGITNSAPLRRPVGQREVTVFMRV